MKEALVEAFWERAKRAKGIKADNYYEAFSFGGSSADELARLVLDQEKTATCSALPLYEIEQQPLPEPGAYSIVLAENGSPLAVIETTRVSIMKMEDVSEDFALAEGEGGYEKWWADHEAFFKQELSQYGLRFDPSLKLVCERFLLVYTEGPAL